MNQVLPDEGFAGAVTPALSGALFGTSDLQRAVATFLADRPGRATFTGR